MSKAIAQAELRSIGHDCLLALDSEGSYGFLQLTPEYVVTAEQAIGAGILATLLRIAEEQTETKAALQTIAVRLSQIAGIQNTARLVEEL